VGGLFDGKLLLRPEATPFTADDPGTQLRSKFRRAVGRCRNRRPGFRRRKPGSQALRELAGGVLGDQDGGDPLAGSGVMAAIIRILRDAFYGARRHPALPMRILLIKTSSLGDVVHNLPVVTDLRARFPDAAIDWVVEEGFADMVRLHPDVRRVHAGRDPALARLAPGSRHVVRNARLPRSAATGELRPGPRHPGLAEKRADHPHGARQALRICRHVGARTRRSTLLRHRFEVPKDLHAVERNRRLAALAGAYVTPGRRLWNRRGVSADYSGTRRRAADRHLARRQALAGGALDRARPCPAPARD
jgi:hypothetical protein